MGAVAEVAGLAKRYGDIQALRGVTFDVHPGEILGYLGPNGSGKTTTLRILIGLVRPSSGAARLFGEPAGLARTRARVGYLPGDLRLDGELTGATLLDHHAHVRGRGGRMARDEVLAVLGLGAADLGRHLRHLSYGTRQKVGLALALQHAPDLLILDEPTNGLDPIVQRRLHAWLRGHAARGGAVLFSSHVLSEVATLCDRVAVVRDGQLVTCERIDVLRGRLPREARVRFTGAPPDHLDGIPGVTAVEIVGHEARLTWSGDARSVVAALAGMAVEDVVLPEPSLETLLEGWTDAERPR